jgi:hypothetical protein
VIPADGEFYVHYYKTSNGGWPVAAASLRQRVMAWDDEGCPMVLGRTGLVPADSLENLSIRAVCEGSDVPADVVDTAPMQRKRVPFGSYIDPELQKDLRVACAVDGIEIRDALDEALRLWLSSKPSLGSQDEAV